MSLSSSLLKGEKCIGVVGCGYVGFSTLAFFASEGVKGMGYDVDKKKVNAINSRKISRDMEKWLPFEVNFDLIRATADWRELEPCNPIFIAVPTEKGTSPFFAPLENAIELLNNFKEKIVIVESTLAPGVSNKIIIPKLKHRLVVAPRRDWFGDRSKTLKTLPRIVGGIDEKTTKEAIEVLSIVCDNLLPCSYKEAELVKVVENGIREVDINFANQLMLAYPSVNVRKVLELAGTKWNIETYHPSLGIGGYCINVACEYLYDGAEDKSQLTLLREIIRTEAGHTSKVMYRLLEKFKPRSVGILGLTYKGNIKVHIASPAVTICDILSAEARMEYAVHDPLYAEEELKKFGYPTFRYPEDLEKFEMLILVADHDLYKSVRPNYSGVVVDNCGIWRKYSSQFRNYVLLGVPFHSRG